MVKRLLAGTKSGVLMVTFNSMPSDLAPPVLTPTAMVEHYAMHNRNRKAEESAITHAARVRLASAGIGGPSRHVNERSQKGSANKCAN